MISVMSYSVFCILPQCCSLHLIDVISDTCKDKTKYKMRVHLHVSARCVCHLPARVNSGRSVVMRSSHPHQRGTRLAPPLAPQSVCKLQEHTYQSPESNINVEQSFFFLCISTTNSLCVCVCVPPQSIDNSFPLEIREPCVCACVDYTPKILDLCAKKVEHLSLRGCELSNVI